MSATPDDSTFTDPEQLIAYLQRQLAEREAELAECRAERDEALEQQTASTEVLQVINSSPGDLQSVFETMRGHAIRLCDANFGHLRTYDGEGFPLAAVHGEPDLVELHQQRFRHFVPGPHNPISRLLRGERLIHIADAAADEAYHNDPGWPQLVATGARSVLAVALRKDDALLGYINVYRNVVGPFAEKQIALVENFAAQAVVAMENARLITETREALEQQTATAEVLQVINSSPGDLAPVFEAVLEKATRLCEAANGSLWIYDGQRLCGAAVYGDPQYAAWLKQQAPVRPVDMAPDRPLRSDRFMQIVDCQEEEAYRTKPFFREMINASRCRTALVVPLCKDEQRLGIMIVYRHDVRPFPDKQIALLQNFAAQAVIAMENARLITETREALEQQTATAEVLAPMSRTEYEAAIAEFLRTKGVTRCPTACAAPTVGTVADPDRAALRSYEDAREAARLQKLRGSGERLPPMSITPA